MSCKSCIFYNEFSEEFPRVIGVCGLAFFDIIYNCIPNECMLDNGKCHNYKRYSKKKYVEYSVKIKDIKEMKLNK
jgi:hypothetical protein